MFKVGGLYYWVGSQLNNPTTAHSIDLYSSPDLMNWTFVKALVTQSGTTVDLEPESIPADEDVGDP